MKEQKLDNYYFVNNSNKKVALEIITGGIDQKSDIAYQILNESEIKHADGYLPPTIIGDNKHLNGKKLIISCIITDTSKDTNYTELRIRLNGGIIFMEFPLFAIVENEGDSVKYSCILHFFNPA